MRQELNADNETTSGELTTDSKSARDDLAAIQTKQAAQSERFNTPYILS